VNVREYWTVLREDKWLVGSVLVVCVAIAAAVALLLPRTYTSTAIFYVASPQTTLSSSDSYQGAQLSTERVKSYSELLTGPRVAADASSLLGGRPSAEEIQRSISADSVAETVVLNLGVTESTPQDAQLVGTAVATSFTRLVNSIESTGQPVNRPIVSTELIYPPTLPTFPAGPGTTMLLAAGVLAGLVLGLGAALGRRALRRAVDTSETLETALGAPVLAAVPGLPRRPDRPALLAEPAPGRRGRRAARARDRAAAVRRLRTAVTASSHGRRCLVIAGVRAEQGTTTVALDLAVALAMAGESVLLVDADLRRPALARRLDLDADRGLATVLDGGPVDRAVQHWAPGGLDVLPAGPGVERPGETWGTTQAAAALRALRDTYSWVLLDASPVATSAESVDLARLADGVVLVVRRGSARPEDLDAAVTGLRAVETPLIGSVFTFAVGVPPAPVEAQRALPPGRSASAPAATPVVEATGSGDSPTTDTAPTTEHTATEQPATGSSTTEPVATTERATATEPVSWESAAGTERVTATEPASAGSTTATEPATGSTESESTESGAAAPVAAAATGAALATAARARRSRTVRRSASDLTRSATPEKISDSDRAPGAEETTAGTPTTDAPAATTAATDTPKRRTSARKNPKSTTGTSESVEPAADNAAATGSGTAAQAKTRTRKARTTPAPVEAVANDATPSAITPAGATLEATEAATPAPTAKPARKPRATRRTGTTTPVAPAAPAVEAEAGTPSDADTPTTSPARTNGSPVGTAAGTISNVTAPEATPAPTTSNGSTPNGSTPNGTTSNGTTSNGTTQHVSEPATPAEPAPSDGTAAPASSSGTGTTTTRGRRATRATSRTSSPTDATTTVEPEESADPEKPARARTTRARTPRASTTGRGPDAADTATRPTRTRASSRTTPTGTPTGTPKSGS
jgi:capsular polysaccharide biosynthesis protein